MNRPRHIVGALFLVTLGAACGEDPIIDCDGPEILISAREMLVKSISLSGPGCEDASIHSDIPSPGAPISVYCDDGFWPYCQSYNIYPRAAGECTVHIELESGKAVDKTVSLVYDSGCGVYYVQGGDRRWSLPDLF